MSQPPLPVQRGFMVSYVPWNNWEEGTEESSPALRMVPALGVDEADVIESFNIAFKGERRLVGVVSLEQLEHWAETIRALARGEDIPLQDFGI